MRDSSPARRPRASRPQSASFRPRRRLRGLREQPRDRRRVHPEEPRGAGGALPAREDHLPHPREVPSAFKVVASRSLRQLAEHEGANEVWDGDLAAGAAKLVCAALGEGLEALAFGGGEPQGKDDGGAVGGVGFGRTSHGSTEAGLLFTRPSDRETVNFGHTDGNSRESLIFIHGISSRYRELRSSSNYAELRSVWPLFTASRSLGLIPRNPRTGGGRDERRW
jgi:hypothetical protein